MPYLYPIAVVLTRAHAGKAGRVGYRLEGSHAQDFSVENVVETTVPGNYHVDDGDNPAGFGPLPDGFTGRIVWGIIDPDTDEVEDIADEWVGPRAYENLDRRVSAACAGDGAIVVADDYNGGDYRVMTCGAPVDGASVRAFLAADYAAGRRGAAYLKGSTTTDAAGRWVGPLLLEPGDYVLVVGKQGQLAATTVELEVLPEEP